MLYFDYRWFIVISRILATPLTKEPELVVETDDENDIPIENKGFANLEHEYDKLPDIEQLCIHVDEDIPLKQLGKIVNVIDRQGKRY